ncbi:MAG: hypothetical protein KC940_18835 [Candidatus Omnitrophica bacterium]|nr:hypothetical protein [Candidatus Omnitrophota bacterium]MCB9768980.1 hypothetical protein [Candidatus Omnitrophota bacterium]
MRVRLYLLAHGRSGDKGNDCNIGVIARRESWYPVLSSLLSVGEVETFLKPIAEGPVQRYELPNLCALNFLVRNALGGGGSKSLRLDAQGKTYAQALLKMPVEITDDLWDEVREFWGDDLPEGMTPA